jgi:hypothetical protein
MFRYIHILAYLFFTCSCLGCVQAERTADDPLRFPEEDYTVETKLVNTPGGEKTVTYYSYRHLPYVAFPVDRDYQSLDVRVPVEIDGVPMDASDAPIFFKIGVGGYMSVNNAGSGPGPSTGARPGPGPGMRPEGGPGTGPGGNQNSLASREDLALAEGFVVVAPGCRGRDNVDTDGIYYGKAPAAIVDLKAAVRYIRHNKGNIPGNPERIVSEGCSAGGALSALLGASGNSPLYEPFLKEIGAAEEQDNIYASACYSPIADLEHADMAYEWMYGALPARSGPVDQELSRQLAEDFTIYQSSLQLQGSFGFGTLTAENYREYLLQYYLIPSASRFLSELPEPERIAYLKANPWIRWSGNSAAFSFDDYVLHVGRMKGLPAFDDFEKQQPEPILFGTRTLNSRHFTAFSLRQETGDPGAELDKELIQVVHMMNPMYFTGQNNRGCAGYWWLRNGTSDNHTSQTVMVNLAANLENLNKDVNAWVFWDGGHCADDDPAGMIAWMKKITAYE